ncbi:nitrogen fixation protein NifZ [Pantoea sp. B65]|uniref:nitrogen fixation protein NifZ n=1 Tax=Pantoea sp. B65 TaxID=2813359 RepID=UPI0039B3B04E
MTGQRFELNQQVRVVRTLRNDGTFAGRGRGEVLVRRGSCGYIRGWGYFLQDLIIWQVHFLDADVTVGCRDVELIDGAAPWRQLAFYFGDQVAATLPLTVNGQVVVAPGDSGEVMETAAGDDEGYLVLFNQRHFRVPQSALRLEQEAQ